MKEIKRDNANIYYEISGSGEFTLLFVHGSYIDQRYWKSQVDYFSRVYKVVTIDLPGQGKSGNERKHWSIQGYGFDVIAVIEQLGLKNVILIGHSMGADVCLIAAHYAPHLITGFISIDYFKNAATPLPQEYQGHVQAILQNLKKDFAETNDQYVRMALVTDKTPVGITDRVVQDYRNAYRPMGLEIMPEIFEAYKLESELLPLLKFKLYLINVDYLPIDETPLKKYAGKGYEIQHMSGTCHFPMIEKPDQLNELIQNYVDKIASTVTARIQVLK